MDEKEKEIMDLLVQAHNKYVKMVSTHPSDLHDWVNGIHTLQDILNRRIVRRDYPNHFVTYSYIDEIKVGSKRTELRLSIFNLPTRMWDHIRAWTPDQDKILISPQELKDMFNGVQGGIFKSSNLTRKEWDFINEYYNLK